MAEQWLSIVEYARTFKVSDMTVRRRIKTGKLHAVLKEGKYFIPIPVGEGRGAVAPERPVRLGESVETPIKRPAETTIIKGHPTAQRTYALESEQGPPLQPRERPESMGGHDSVVPASLRRPLASMETSLVDTRALLAFCEATLRKVGETERRVVEKFKSKLEALEATLVSKDQEIKSLRQQVEDLQLLVKILERGKID